MGKPKCRAFRLLRYFLLSLCLSPSTPPGRLDRSVFHVTQLPRRKYHPYIFAKSWTRSFVPSFRIYLPNISFSLPSFFLSFFFLPMLRSKHRNLKETEGVELQTRIYVQSLIN